MFIREGVDSKILIECCIVIENMFVCVCVKNFKKIGLVKEFAQNLITPFDPNKQFDPNQNKTYEYKIF